MKILALDQETSCGWALGADDGKGPKGGLWVLPEPAEDEPNAPMLLMLRESLTALMRREPFEYIAFEDRPYIRGRFTPHTDRKRFGLDAVIELFCHDHGIDYGVVGPHDWHRRFIGCKYAPSSINVPAARHTWWKEQSVLACLRRMWDCQGNHHIADAMGIWDYAMSEMSEIYEGQRQAAHEVQVAHTHKIDGVVI
jgi:hypothetical protein